MAPLASAGASGSRRFHRDERGRGQCGVGAKPDGDCCKEAERAKIAPMDGGRRTSGVCRQADDIRCHCPEHAAKALGCEIKRHAEGVLDQHHEREGQRHAGQRIRAEPADEQPVEGDHAGDRRQVQDVGRREPQQRREDRAFEQQPGARGYRTSSGTGRATGRRI